jgi:putative transposase
VLGSILRGRMNQKAYKFRIYPNKTQTVLLNKTFGCVRYAWNQWVENFNKPTDKVFSTPKELKEKLDWMKEVSSAAIQQKERDFNEFKNQYFNKKRKSKVGRPSFKSKRNKQSYRLPNQKFYLDDNRIQFEKIGFVKVVLDRSIPEDVKFINATISKDNVGDFFVSILVEENIQPKPQTEKEIGIDVGLKSFVTLSDGTSVDNPKFFRENQSEIKRIQQHLSRKVKGSNRRRGTQCKLAKTHRTISRQRSFFLHNLSSWLVNNYDVIAIEDLNVTGMVKNHCMAKSISDAAWSEFFRQITYKCNWYGKELRKTDRFEPTTKTCSVCGYCNNDLTLVIREWNCPCCGAHHDRDENAAVNILNKSTSVRVDTELQTWRGCKTSGKQTEAIPYEASMIE